ncbi:Xyloglucan galactosyltransferase KATAMARI1-like protein [Hibiscus syriacus]|uniref:Xyloglucan galactosyltransferase KATAMARI1-like protein n=1 Tax=Hibiscus syriacus TaxID=106335 RepID=A0A6A2WU18_HIBSY|nr:probable xyloglucan galactosyltransferase GT14 [Hibiscus syriacus]KAE8658420.1 Xyloglucan galactosyltransferase KATAMARI1-like protein [Hibiscus syriacus]
MEKKLIINGGHCHNQFWFTVLLSFVFCFLLFCFDYSVLYSSNSGVSFYSEKTQKANQLAAIDEPSEIPDSQNFPFPENNVSLTIVNNVTDPCSGKYIYVHRLPRRFNVDVLEDCRNLVKWFNMCPSLMNSGFGPKVETPQGVLSEKNWFETNQFMLELIFHQRIKQYECLTNDSSMASAVYIPFYAGLDVGRYLWGYNVSVRDSSAFGIVHWLRKQREWNRMFGRDHFFVAGRIAWDFRRRIDNESDWGSRLMNLPEFMNITVLSIESSSWSNEFAVPYPTYFHPSSDIDVIRWQKRVRARKRRHLFCFAGAPRPTMKDSIRGEIINQCLSANQTCRFLDCKAEGNKCNTPVEVIKVFRDCKFCLQPPGDSYTRRSTFDSIISGCIPVFFHPYSAYAQYIWYFPKNYTKYSVYIPEIDIKTGNVSIDRALSRYSEHRIKAMRKEVVKLIPKVIYANPKSRFERYEDAIDIAVKRVLERVNKVGEITREGKDPSVEFAAGNQWKSKLSGIVGDQPLEPLF